MSTTRGRDSLPSSSRPRRSPRAAPAGPVGTTSPSSPPAPVRARSGSALAAVSHLTVKGRTAKTGYRRDQFGDGWASVDGCDTRDRILARDLLAKSFRSATRRCVVL